MQLFFAIVVSKGTKKYSKKDYENLRVIYVVYVLLDGKLCVEI